MIDELVRQSAIFELAMAEGKREGKQEGERATVQLVLEGRFGTLDPALLAAIAAADEATLHAVARRAATDSLDALRALLTNAGTGEQTAAENAPGNTQEPST